MVVEEDEQMCNEMKVVGEFMHLCDGGGAGIGCAVSLTARARFG